MLPAAIFLFPPIQNLRKYVHWVPLGLCLIAITDIGAWFQSLVWPSLALRSVISSSSNVSDCDTDRYLASEQ